MISIKDKKSNAFWASLNSKHIESLASDLMIESVVLPDCDFEVDILRADQLHYPVSGNKVFKLLPWLDLLQDCQSVVSCGGRYSNHLHALAWLCHLKQIPLTGLIRSHPLETLTITLEDCKNWGMNLKFLTRESFRKLRTTKNLAESYGSDESSLFIPEGGTGLPGIKGCFIWWKSLHERLSGYDYICTAVGSGGTFTGLAAAIESGVNLGYVVLKNGHYLQQEVARYLSALGANNTNWELIHCHHQGGFAKQTPELLNFMDRFYASTEIRLDPVYTSKVLLGMRKDYILGRRFRNSKVLMVHTGGLQGARSRI